MGSFPDQRLVIEPIVWHEIFAGSYSCDFPSDAQIKITANILPAKIYSRVNILELRNHVCSIITCLFHSQTFLKIAKSNSRKTQKIASLQKLTTAKNSCHTVCGVTGNWTKLHSKLSNWNKAARERQTCEYA